MTNYFITSVIWQSLEPWYNAGIASARAKEIIEKMHDPSNSMLHLRCEQAGLNGNWNVHTSSNDQDTIYLIVCMIENAMNNELVKMKKKPLPVHREKDPFNID